MKDMLHHNDHKNTDKETLLFEFDSSSLASSNDTITRSSNTDDYDDNIDIDDILFIDNKSDYMQSKLKYFSKLNINVKNYLVKKSIPIDIKNEDIYEEILIDNIFPFN